ncbi:MAG: hypothetical protein KC656_20710, partial [Myxococcales bacterium]|nr:hypothetical protein [Myxococcales bacterium]
DASIRADVVCATWNGGLGGIGCRLTAAEGRVVAFQAGGSLEGFRVRQQAPITSNGGCVRADGADLTLVDVEMEGCSAGNGGALYAAQAVPLVTLERVTITGAEGLDGGAISLQAGVDLVATELTVTGTTSARGALHARASNSVQLTDVVFEDDTASLGQGGAIWIADGDLLVSGGLFVGNVADHGGAVHAMDTDLGFVSTLFSDNEPNADPAMGGELGGAVYVEGGSLVDIAGVYQLNEAEQGGAIYGYLADIDLQGTTLEDNTSNVNGAMALFGGRIELTDVVFSANTGVAGSTAALYTESLDNGSFLADVQIVGNSTTGWAAKLRSATGATVEVDRIVVQNPASGNGIDNTQGVFRYRNALVTGHADVGIGMLLVGGDSALELESCTIAANGGNGVQYLANGDGQLVFRNSIIADNGGLGISEVLSGPGVETHSYAYTSVWGNGNGAVGAAPVSVDGMFDEVDPQFVGPGSWQRSIHDDGDPLLPNPGSTTSERGAYGGPTPLLP